MQALHYVKDNFIPFTVESFQIVKQYQHSLFTDTLKDFEAILKEKTSDRQLKEIQVRLKVVRTSIIVLISSLALKALGTLIASPFLCSAGNLLFFTAMTAGFISLAGIAANLTIKTYSIKGSSELK